MKRFLTGCATSLAAAVVLTSCSSPQDNVNDACAEVKDVVNSLPQIRPDDTARQIIPLIDTQLEAAEKAQSEFGEAGMDAGFQAAWQGMLDAMRNNRAVWQDPLAGTGAPRRMGSDLIGALNLGSAKSKVETAKDSLKFAADKNGYVDCGDSVQWRY